MVKRKLGFVIYRVSWEVWRVEYDGSNGKQFIEEDLIDALYKACVTLKEDGGTNICTK